MKTTTSSFKECLYKLLLFASTIILELLLGYTESSGEYTAFYLTVLVQSVNNFYDSSGYLDTEKFAISSIVRTSLTMISSVGAFGASICYITSKDGSELKLLLSSGIALYIVAGLLAIIIIFLIVELIIHLAILFHQQKNSAKSSDSTACAKTTGAKNFFSDDSLDYMDLYMYRHGENDILFRLPDRKS